MIRVLSLFSGIGAFEVALDEENIEWELDHYCEIDRYACMSYNMIHGTADEDNLKDVTNIDYSKIGDIDLVTYGFPCQDISLAGNQKGFIDKDGNITRSGLFFNAAEIISHTKPKFAIFENVKNLTSKKFKAEFETVLSVLDELGYNTYWKVLNAKDYGIPQNRERVFGISIRKDIDKGYTFPQGFELTLRLKDMLEEQVEEKYYLSQDKVDTFSKKFDETPYALLGGEQQHQSVKKDGISTTLTSSMGTGGGYVPMINELKIQRVGKTKSGGQRSEIIDSEGICSCLSATDYKQPKQILESKRIGGLFDDEKGKHQAGSIWDTDHLSPTLDTMQGGYRQPCIMIKEKTNRGYKEAYDGDGVYINRPHQKRGVVQHGMIQTLKMSCSDVGVVLEEPILKANGCDIRPKDRDYKKKGTERVEQVEVRNDELSNALLTVHQHNLCQINDFRIRKLTPRECFRLQGFKDKYFDRIQGVSNSQLYKQAGNSIVVDVPRAIFRELKKQYPDDFEDIWEEEL